MGVGAIASFEVVTGLGIFPDLTGPILAGVIIGISFGWAFVKSNRREKLQQFQKAQSEEINYYDPNIGDDEDDMYFRVPK
jgi:hypothetical protein